MKWLILSALLAIAVIAGISIYLQPNSFIGCNATPSQTGKCAKSDAIVVVSGGDTQARTDAGINLYKNGWADTLILSGAAQDKSGPSNAAAMEKRAIAAGIPELAILIDEESASTQENAKNTTRLFADKNYNDIILVTSGYHQRRASLEFNKQVATVEVRNSPVAHDKDWGWYWWVTPRGWWLAGGELAKVVAFYLGATA